MQDFSRRQFIKQGLCATAVVALPFSQVAFPQAAWGATPVKELAFYNLHTEEKLRLAFCEHGRYIPAALDEINYFLRDYRTGDIQKMDPALFDQLHALQQKVETPGAFHVISGYRSPKTNQALADHSDGVAKHSLHMEGRAIDIRLPGKDLSLLHKAALDMGAGGVGYYPQSDFIHLDTGRARFWG